MYLFQAMITLDQPASGRSATLLSGHTSRMTLRGLNSETGATRFFSAMVANDGESTPGQADDHCIVTVCIPSPDAADYFSPGAEFTLWLGGDIAHGIVTRRKVVWPLTA